MYILANTLKKWIRSHILKLVKIRGRFYGKEVARLVSHDKSVSFLTDSLIGVLKNDHNEKESKTECIQKYESAD